MSIIAAELRRLDSKTGFKASGGVKSLAQLKHLLALCEGVAEHAIALLFAVAHQTGLKEQAIRKSTWTGRSGWNPVRVRGKTLGLIGFGHIAQSVTRLIRGFEMKVLAYDPHVSNDTMEKLGVRAVGLAELLSLSDFVSIH